MSFFRWGKNTDTPKARKRSGSATESSSSSNVTGVNPFPVTTTTTTDTTPAATQPTGGLLKSDVHKMANPLDWNNIPDFIKKRFPHWKNSATATTTTTTSQPILDNKDIEESASFQSRQRSFSFSKQPANTAMYSVLPSDTLTSIALKFSTTPSELYQLNKMATRTMIPGQILYVPDQNDSTLLEVSNQETSSSRNGSLPSSFAEEVASTHIKIRAKYITTDQGCCKGSLLLTTASVMFKPSENDPLVLEHGHSPFGIILTMKDITHASIVSDFAKLVELSPKLQRSKSSQENLPSDTTDTNAKVNVEQTKQVPVELPPSDVDSGCVEGTTPGRNIDSSMELCEDATSREKPPVLRIFTPSTEDSDLSPLPPTPGRVVRVFSDPQHKPHSDTTDEMLAIMGVVDGQDSSQDNINPSIHKLLTNPEMMNFRLYQSYNADDGSSVRHKDIDAPQFLKIRVASHAYHTFVPTVGTGLNIPQKSDAKVQVYTKTEFWFAFPSERTDELISFFMTSYSHTLGEVGILHKWTNGMFVLINEQTSSSGSSTGDMGLNENHYSNTSSSWETYSLSDIPRERILKMEVEDDLPLPVLSEQSELMDPYHIQQLSKNLISTAVGHDWILLYSTFKHGMSLKTLYRNMVEYGDNPVLLFVRDTTSQSFGAVLSCQLKISEHYYGTGESFLFKFKPNTAEAILELKVYQWSGENDFIIKGNPDSLVLGGGEDGHFGLWIDDQFYHGSSYMCKTFNNECLSSNADFICHGVEVWGFV